MKGSKLRWLLAKNNLISMKIDSFNMGTHIFNSKTQNINKYYKSTCKSMSMMNVDLNNVKGGTRCLLRHCNCLKHSNKKTEPSNKNEMDLQDLKLKGPGLFHFNPSV